MSISNQNLVIANLFLFVLFCFLDYNRLKNILKNTNTLRLMNIICSSKSKNYMIFFFVIQTGTCCRLHIENWFSKRVIFSPYHPFCIICLVCIVCFVLFCFVFYTCFFFMFFFIGFCFLFFAYFFLFLFVCFDFFSCTEYIIYISFSCQ